MRSPHIQISDPGARILPRNNDAGLGAILRNRVLLPLTADLTIPGTSTLPIVGAVLKPVDAVHDTFTWKTTLAVIADIGVAASAGSILTLSLYTGAFTVNGAAPAPGVYYGNGTPGFNEFAGGATSEITTASIEFDPTELHQLITMRAMVSPAEVPGATPFVGIVLRVTTDDAVTDLIFPGSPSAPAGVTFMREMP